MFAKYVSVVAWCSIDILTLMHGYDIMYYYFSNTDSRFNNDYKLLSTVFDDYQIRSIVFVGCFFMMNSVTNMMRLFRWS